MHIRSLLSLSLAAAFAAALPAQCLQPGSGAPAGLSEADDALSPVLAMGITFPMAGAAAPTYTHCVVSSNGVVYLTNGAAAVNAADNQYGSVANLRGLTGASPRIAPFWQDLWDAFYPGVAWSVVVDTSVAGRCAITWKDTCEFPLDTPPVDFRVELFSSGIVTFTYGNADLSAFGNTTMIGVSVGDGIADPGPSDLSATPASTTGILYEAFAPGPFDLSGQQFTFFPSGAGYVVTRTCEPARNTAYGAGCYARSNSVYQSFADAALAAAALGNQSLVLAPAGSEYLLTWGGGTFVPPSGGATTLTGFAPLLDDGVVTVNLGSPLPIPGGTTATLVVHSNGNVWVADNLGALTDDFTPVVGEMLDAPNAGWWAWHDFNPNEAGSGQIKFEEVGTVSYLTWDDVESYPTGTTNRGTLQFQFDRATGIVTMLWTTVDANTASIFGSSHVVGWSPGGASVDTGSTPLATALPIVTQPQILPLTLSASPAPVSTPISGATVTYTTSNMSEFAPGSGVYIGLVFFSGASAPAVDLGLIGAPGCLAHVLTLDVSVAMVGATATQAVAFPLPSGVTPGTEIFVQSVCLVTPNSLPNGQNPFGLTTSNGIVSLISPF